MISGERKKFELRSARAPALVHGLSNTVIVYEDGAAKYCHIGFADALALEVGKRMPRGISNFEPAFLSVAFDTLRSAWVVSSHYVSTWERVGLWQSEEKPAWIKQLKTIRHNNERTSTQAVRARSRTEDHTGYATVTASA